MTRVDLEICAQAAANTMKSSSSVAVVEQLLDRLKAFLLEEGATSQRFEVQCPADGRAFVDLPDMSACDAENAIRRAESGWREWGHLSPERRRDLMLSWADNLRRERAALVRLINLEQGKPVAEAEAELRSGLAFIDWYANIVVQQQEPGRLSDRPGDNVVRKVVPTPTGVVGAVTPWNFPLSMAIRKIAPALAAGCSIVLKPSEHTPLCGSAVVMLAREAGIPAQAVHVITTSDPNPIGLTFTRSVSVRAITMTGSTKTGRWLLTEAAAQIKPVYLELGGNAPFIVCSDADIDAAVSCAFATKFRNAGQICIAPNRFLLERSIAQHFHEALLCRTKAFLEHVAEAPNENLAPIITASGRNRIQTLVENSVELGAHVTLGGQPVSGRGHFFQPTVVWNVSDEMPLAQEEVFGPVASLLVFDSDDEVIERANATDKGLAGYIFSQNPKRAQAIASTLEVGMVGANTAVVSDPAAPFGGVKQSGIGREGGFYGLSQFVEPKYLCFAPAGSGFDPPE